MSAHFIQQELDWFTSVLNTRLKLYFSRQPPVASVFELPPPEASGDSNYEQLIRSRGLLFEDRICLMLSLVPSLQPQLLDCFLVRNSDTERNFTEFGCITGPHHQGMIPTLETLLFMLSAGSLPLRIRYLDYFGPHYFLFRDKMVWLSEPVGFEPFASAVIRPSSELVSRLLYEKPFVPLFSPDFPAQRITTGQEWNDLVLEEEVLQHVEEIKIWLTVGNQMLEEWELKKKMKPGYRCLFYGPSGTGKTFTASLLGKYTGHEVFRIDLSLVVSKYIGETEKNLSKIFERAESHNWILFFDEADALFGKRTQIKDAHDRYANQEVSYLLQRVEDYPGLVILSTNLKSNIDEAFARRFQNVVHFPMPDAEKRERLWHNTFSPHTRLEPTIDLAEVARRYTLSGGAILNVVMYASLMAKSRNSSLISGEELLRGIRRELHKEGKTGA